MHQDYRSQLSYHKQMVAFEFCFAELAHPEWLEGIPVSKKLKTNPSQALILQTHLLMEKNPYLSQASFLEKDLSLLCTSLPQAKFQRFLNYLVLAFLKNDKSLLINGNKLKQLRDIYSNKEMQFLLFDRNLILPLRSKLFFDNDFVISQESFQEVAYLLLKSLFSSQPVVVEFLKYRFSKETVSNETYDFMDILDLSQAEAFLQNLVGMLYPQLLLTFQIENNLSSSENPAPSQNSSTSLLPKRDMRAQALNKVGY